jgi:hypothetical protein
MEQAPTNGPAHLEDESWNHRLEDAGLHLKTEVGMSPGLRISRKSKKKEEPLDRDLGPDKDGELADLRRSNLTARC